MAEHEHTDLSGKATRLGKEVKGWFSFSLFTVYIIKFFIVWQKVERMQGGSSSNLLKISPLIDIFGQMYKSL
jgi:hypothetical protein